MLPRGERAQTQIPALVPTAGDKDGQVKVFVPTVFNAQFPQQHLYSSGQRALLHFQEPQRLQTAACPLTRGFYEARSSTFMATEAEHYPSRAEEETAQLFARKLQREAPPVTNIGH